MSSVSTTERCLSALDHARLRKLPASEALSDLLDTADVMAGTDVPPDLVTLYSRVRVHDSSQAGPQELTLCYPRDANPQTGFISVLSPVGLALLGRRVGAQVEWTPPHGAPRRLTLDAVLFQPEASGDYLT